MPSGPEGPCSSMMPNGKAQVFFDACNASTKSEPVQLLPFRR